MKGKANLVALSLVLATTVAGCANSIEPSPSSTGTPTSATASSTTAPPTTAPSEPAGTPLPEKQLDAQALLEAYPKQVVVSPDAKKLIITAQESGCGKASAELEEQNPQRVKVILVETVPADAQMCTMDIRYPKVTVELDQALGERIVELSSQQRKN